MNKKITKVSQDKKATQFQSDQQQPQQQRTSKRQSKLSEYGKQLQEKQKVKRMYGVLEKQFRRFFSVASKQKGAPGENLLRMLECRLDNVLYRLKFSVTRRQARQLVVHGHILVNKKHVYSPSYIVNSNDVISLVDSVKVKEKFLEQVIDKRLNVGIKVPEWLELDKKNHSGIILRLPVRSDVQSPIEEHLIVELYSK